MNKYFKKPFAKKEKCVIISKRMGKYHHLNDVNGNKTSQTFVADYEYSIVKFNITVNPYVEEIEDEIIFEF
mgnify:CR=1 FL=1